MAETSIPREPGRRPAWWRSIGPALITACVVFGPGSLLISSNVGAKYGCELLWMLILSGILMGTYMTTAARIGVVGGMTPCTLIAQRLGRPAAAVVSINLCLICTTFQFANNLAVVAAARALVPEVPPIIVLVALNGLIITFLFTAKHVYQLLEKVMKVMVGVILVSFVINLVLAAPNLIGISKGLIPGIPDGLSFELPHRVEGKIEDSMLLIASLLGTTFSVAAAFYQGNLVRERGWTIKDYSSGISDSIAGVTVITTVSAVIMITTATVIPGKQADDIGVLAQALQPLLGSTAYIIFCVGLFAVAMNPFLINAIIGGSILADGLGKPPRLSDRFSRIFTVVVLLVGMVVATLALRTGQKPVSLIIFGSALTVIGNPLMAATILWLANNKAIMGEHRNNLIQNTLGVAGFIVVVFMAVRVLIRVALNFV
ncbi:MAG: Nramp family divalent metal transporter [Phycisphaerales bacterium]|nr:MAG: Nramp family divalent metal transporter [Phycisphaerales bacterium]